MEKNYFERGIFEANYNDLASKYIAENYESIRIATLRMGISEEYSYDLVNDVWVSIKQDEENGDGFDSTYGQSMTVEKFIYGRIKLYSKNKRYSNNGRIEISASSDCGSDIDTLSDVQKAYALAADYDDIEAVNDTLSLRKNIEFCVEFESSIGFSIINLLKNMDLLIESTVSPTIFSKLRSAVDYHNEFGEAFREILNVRLSNRNLFDAVLESI